MQLSDRDNCVRIRHKIGVLSSSDYVSYGIEHSSRNVIFGRISTDPSIYMVEGAFAKTTLSDTKLNNHKLTYSKMNHYAMNYRNLVSTFHYEN